MLRVRNTSKHQRNVPFWGWLLVICLALLQMCLAEGVGGGELATLSLLDGNETVMYRQNVCERYSAFRNGTINLRDALQGSQLNVLMMNYDGGYFEYDETTGIDMDYPGLAAVLMDELGERAGFTWRNSFGVHPDPSQTNRTWTEVLFWGIEMYDLHVDWWAQNLERMNNGVAFLEAWYDSSIILVTLKTPEVASSEISFWGFLRPYEWEVWLLTIFTIFISGVVYQILEWLGDYRDDRTFWDWFAQNWYLASINFTQAYEYRPKNNAMRVFGVSMACWSLVMTATYTANLASLLVDRNPTAVVVETIQDAAANNYKICTLKDTNSDIFIKTKYPSITRIPKITIADLYEGLNRGDCEFAAETKTAWEENKGIREYNPMCNLAWVGGDRKVLDGSAGFATKADSGFFCSGLIRDVVNLHMKEMIEDGFVDEAWEQEHQRSQSIDCLTFRPELAALEAAKKAEEEYEEELDRRRNLQHSKEDSRKQTESNARQRFLKASDEGGALGAQDEGQRLTWKQMIGVFVFHYSLLAATILISVITNAYSKEDTSNDTTTKGRKLERTGKSCESFASCELGNQNTIEVSAQDVIAMQEKIDSLQDQMRWENESLKEQIQMLVAAVSGDKKFSSAGHSMSSFVQKDPGIDPYVYTT